MHMATTLAMQKQYNADAAEQDVASWTVFIALIIKLHPCMHGVPYKELSY